ncbi:MAG: hypothetical protein AAGA96_08195 [Verrucomicrobiota bacterium]
MALTLPTVDAESIDAGEQLVAYSPKNLARFHLGAGIDAQSGLVEEGSVQLSRGCVDTNRAINALLVDDASIGFPISRGQTSFVVTLPDIEMLQTLTFSKRGLEGTVTVESSVPRLERDASGWRRVGYLDMRESDQAVQINLGFAEAKYLRVSVDAVEPGRIYGFGVFGESLLVDYELLSAPEGDGDSISSMSATDLNLAGGLTGSRVMYLSDGQDVVKGAPLLDGDSITSTLLSTSDPAVHIVVDLRETYLMDRASALYAGFEGDVRVYVVDQLPESGRPDAPWLRELTPVAEITDSEGFGIAGLDFEPVAGRYLVFEWAAHERQSLDALSVSEIGAFSSPGVSGLRVVGLGNGGGVGYGKDGYGKSGPGGKSIIPEPAYDPEAEMRREMDMMHRAIRGGYFPGGSGLTSQIISERIPPLVPTATFFSP